MVAATYPLRDALVEREFRESEFGLHVEAARVAAGDRAILAVLGTSQTERSVDPAVLERTAFEDPAKAPCVFNFGVDGLHASVHPFALRRVLAAQRIAGVVMELGHVDHDQYGGAWIVRDFLEDDAVGEAFRGNDRGRRLMRDHDRERKMPWSYVPQLLRRLHDESRRRSEGELRELVATRGFRPLGEKKDPDRTVRDLNEIVARETDYVDASPQRTFVASAGICARLCAERGVPFAVFLHPVNRTLAPRITILRHFEEEARGTTIPALRALGIDVLVPPDEFFDDSLYSDHVHLTAAAAPRFSAWLGGALRGLGRFR